MDFKFELMHKGKTASGSNYFKLMVEIEPDIWVEARYFGNTVPKKVTAVTKRADGSWVVSIQPHTSRDKDTGKFKSYKRVLR